MHACMSAYSDAVCYSAACVPPSASFPSLLAQRCRQGLHLLIYWGVRCLAQHQIWNFHDSNMLLEAPADFKAASDKVEALDHA